MKYSAVEFEGDEPLIVIWEQPYRHGGPAKEALGWYTPQEASDLLSIPTESIVATLTEKGVLDTPLFSQLYRLQHNHDMLCSRGVGGLNG